MLLDTALAVPPPQPTDYNTVFSYNLRSSVTPCRQVLASNALLLLLLRVALDRLAQVFLRVFPQELDIPVSGRCLSMLQSECLCGLYHWPPTCLPISAKQHRHATPRSLLTCQCYNLFLCARCTDLRFLVEQLRLPVQLYDRREIQYNCRGRRRLLPSHPQAT